MASNTEETEVRASLRCNTRTGSDDMWSSWPVAPDAVRTIAEVKLVTSGRWKSATGVPKSPLKVEET